ncbi:MAG: hypothetical protein R3B13_10370 [Polyangiaceae bacterium]
MALAEGARFRGKLGIAVRKALREFDGGAVERARARMSASARALVTRRYLASDWYDVEGIDEVIEVLSDELGLPPEMMARRFGASVGDTGAGPVGRAMVTVFGTPQRFERYLPTMWRQLYDSGTMHARFDPVDAVLSVRVYGWKGHSSLHCFAPLGAVEALARHIRSPSLVDARRVECVGDGAKRCAYELTFAR